MSAAKRAEQQWRLQPRDRWRPLSGIYPKIDLFLEPPPPRRLTLRERIVRWWQWGYFPR